MNLRSCIVKLCKPPARFRELLSKNRRAQLPKACHPNSQIFIASRSFTNTHKSRNDAVIKSLRESRNNILTALKSGEVDEISYHFDFTNKLLLSLPLSMRSVASKAHLNFSRRHLGDIAGALASRSSKNDAELLFALQQDCHAIHNITLDSFLLECTLRALVKSGQQTRAYNLVLFHFRAKKYIIPNSLHWLLVIKGLKEIEDVDRIKEGLRLMKKSWPYPSIDHYAVLIDVLVQKASGKSATELEETLEEIQTMKLPYCDKVYRALKRKEKLLGLAERYKSGSTAEVASSRSQDWLERLQEARRKGRSNYERELRAVRSEGFVPNVRSLAGLVGGLSVSTIKEVEFLQRTLETEANVVVWSIVIRNVLEKRTDVMEAIEVYEAARAAGVQPDPAMVHPILRALCNGTVTEPSDYMLSRALQIYDDLMADPYSAAGPNDDKDSSFRADTAIYNTLLRALSSSSNKRKYFPIALSVLRDMAEAQVKMDAMTATSIAILLMRSADSYQSAHDAYRRVRELGRDMFDAKGYSAILNAYCDLVFGYPPFPSAKDYFSIVSDMQSSGFQRTPEVYTILLGRYANLATRLTRDVQDRREQSRLRTELESVIKMTHSQLKLDAVITPDTPLWNQLMDTYNRVGSLSGVMQIWNQLKSGGQANNASVSIVLDACGYLDAYEKGAEILLELIDSGFPLNRRNWNSWVECLCRLGQLDDAMKAVCLEMPKQADEEAHPDESTIRILHSFAKRGGREDELYSRVRLYLPNLWHSLPEDLRN